MAKEGSTVSGLMDSFSCAISLALQHGVPLKMLCEKFAHTRFEPSGWTNNPDIGFAKSIMDYIFRWLQLRFLTGQQQMLFENLRPRLAATAHSPEAGDLPATDDGRRPSASAEDRRPRTSGAVHAADALAEMIDLGDAPTCHVCGSIMVRNGSCYKCMTAEARAAAASGNPGGVAEAPPPRPRKRVIKAASGLRLESARLSRVRKVHRCLRQTRGSGARESFQKRSGRAIRVKPA
jgi:hypothetical protein